RPASPRRHPGRRPARAAGAPAWHIRGGARWRVEGLGGAIALGCARTLALDSLLCWLLPKLHVPPGTHVLLSSRILTPLSSRLPVTMLCFDHNSWSHTPGIPPMGSPAYSSHRPTGCHFFSITHCRGCWCFRAKSITCVTFVSATSYV